MDLYQYLHQFDNWSCGFYIYRAVSNIDLILFSFSCNQSSLKYLYQKLWYMLFWLSRCMMYAPFFHSSYYCRFISIFKVIFIHNYHSRLLISQKLSPLINKHISLVKPSEITRTLNYHSKFYFRWRECFI